MLTLVFHAGHSSFSFSEQVAKVDFAQILAEAIAVTGSFGLTTRPTGMTYTIQCDSKKVAPP